MMDSQNLKPLLNDRTQLRRLFTVQVKKVEEVMKNGDSAVINKEFAKLADKAERLFAIDQKVSEITLSFDIDEDERNNEYDTIEKYRDTWISLVETRNSMVKKENESDNISFSNSGTGDAVNNKKIYKLPKLVFKKFDGNIRNWIGFWSQFQKIHNDTNLDIDTKFHYLLQLTTEGSHARELVESFPPLADNYMKAIELLKARFGRDDLLIELYVRELLGLVLKQASNNKISSLRSLYDKLETQLRALETLGVTSEKYACMLYPLVESVLPESVLREWERKRSRADREKDSIEPLNELLNFLKREVEGEERISLAKEGLSPKSESPVNDPPPKLNKKNNESHSKPKIATAHELVNVNKHSKRICSLCKGHHYLEECFKLRSLEIDEISKLFMENGHCLRCTKRGHLSKFCKAYLKCIICNGRHAVLMCPDRKNRCKKREYSPSNNVNLPPDTTLGMANAHSNQVFLKTLKVVVQHNNKKYACRLFFDEGSQRSYMTDRMISLLDYKPLGTEKIIHCLFGGKRSEPEEHKIYEIEMNSVINDYTCKFKVLNKEIICDPLPVLAPMGSLMNELKQKNISLSGEEWGPIDVLVGADIAGKLFTGNKQILNCGLVAFETYLGWTLMGKIYDESNVFMNNVSCTAVDLSAEQLWRLDVIGIEDPVETRTKKEMIAVARNQFLEKLNILEDGRYQVGLPWIEGHPPIPRNFDISRNRLESVTKKLKRSGLEKQYEDVLKEWLREDIIEEVPMSDWDIGHYLPHRPVVKEGSTTRIRPVFDASARVGGQPSLNQCLEKGVNLIELIPDILLRFRMNKIGVIADIKKAFLQISVNKEDRDFLRFLWKDSVENKLKIFRHKRVVFGVTSSPFLLAALLEHHLERCEVMTSQGKLCFSSSIIAMLKKSFYVDNCVAAVNDNEDLDNFMQQSINIFNKACFELRGWEWSDPSLEHSTETPILGLIWDRKEDNLSVNSPDWDNVEKENVTRRTILSATQRIFDPIGFTAPTTLNPKLLVQRTWQDGGDWDSPVDENIKNCYLEWIKEASLLKQIKVQRWFEDINMEGNEISLHVFCDASKVAYAAATFLRVKKGNTVKLFLVQARARVAPMKITTIPRLELLAAVIGARLCNSILEEFPNVPVQYWTDSSTVIAWITREEPWGIFVWNRVNEIRKLSKKESWSHVPGLLNPADFLTRGCTPRSLVLSHWWEGPHWLKEDAKNWPTSELTVNEDEVMTERKRTSVTSISCINENSFIMDLLRSISRQRFYLLVRKVAFIKRFVTNCRIPKEERILKSLTVAELNQAERIILKTIQKESFTGVDDKILRKLKPHIDSFNLIRVRTKIWARKDTEDFRSPIILPTKHPIVDLLILEKHLIHSHVMGQGLLSILRENYWILKGRQTIRRVTSKCVRCRRFIAKAFDAETPPLPEERVRDASIFEIIGTDLAGPLYLVGGSKVWICIFTCAVFRAVHLELVSSLSTDVYMLAFRRFVARRGRPRIVFSDNGTNFRGMNKAIGRLDWEEISSVSSAQPIQWRFNPPAAAWWGGFYERLIGILKDLLRRNLGRASLNHEELYTLLNECEALINSRPITYLSEDSGDPIPLTPQMFLQDVREIGVPDCDKIEAVNLSKRHRYRQRLKLELMKRFRSEYLGQLKYGSHRFRNTREPVIGEVVLISTDEKKRINWPLAVIENLIPGRDGRCRVVLLRTAEGHLWRPVQKIYALEVLPEEEVNKEGRNIEQRNKETTEKKKEERTVVRNLETRCGRKVTVPIRYPV